MHSLSDSIRIARYSSQLSSYPLLVPNHTNAVQSRIHGLWYEEERKLTVGKLQVSRNDIIVLVLLLYKFETVFEKNPHV
jgi:hypothetical protein